MKTNLKHILVSALALLTTVATTVRLQTSTQQDKFKMKLHNK